MTDTTRSLVFRGEDGTIRSTFATTVPAYRKGTGMLLQLTHGGDEFPSLELDAHEVEELHQFTFDLLAGPQRDPRLAEIMCEGHTYSPVGGHLECALVDGHKDVGPYRHVTRTGIPFDDEPAF